MMMSGRIDPFVYVFAGCGILIVTSLIFVAIQEQSASRCLAAGYPEMRWPNALLGGTRYCVKRVNQTDVVVPLSAIEQGKAR